MLNYTWPNKKGELSVVTAVGRLLDNENGAVEHVQSLQINAIEIAIDMMRSDGLGRAGKIFCVMQKNGLGQT